MRGAADCGHRVRIFLFVVQVVDVILGLSEVNEFELVVRQEEQVGGFDIAMADTAVLQKRRSRDDGAVHSHQFFLFPGLVGFLPLPVDILQVHVVVHELSDNTKSECVVHCLAEVVAIEFDDIRVVLHCVTLFRYL